MILYSQTFIGDMRVLIVLWIDSGSICFRKFIAE